VTVCRLFLVTNNYTSSEEQQFSRQLRERLLAAPGVTGAAYSDSIPLGFGLGKWDAVMVEGYASRPGENLDVHHASVSPGYFDLLRMPLLDRRDPVGRRVQVYGEPFTIVVKPGTVHSIPNSGSSDPAPGFGCHAREWTAIQPWPVSFATASWRLAVEDTA
jgi:hypothetical protein